MGEIIKGLGHRERERIRALRTRGAFFWIDVSLSQTSGDDLTETLGVPDKALDLLLDFGADSASTRRFHADGRHVAFSFWCFETSGSGAGGPEALQPIELHVLISGEYILTLHVEAVSLPDVLEVDPPEGRSEQYLVYAILDAMVGTAFDALGDVQSTLEELQLMSSDMGSSQLRMATLRMINSRLSRMRRRLGPQRGIFERISEEIEQVRGLGADSRPYLERIDQQLIRLIAGIDAADDALARLIDLRLNETIYWLTVVATIFLPLTFVTGFFGMNFSWMVDRIDTAVAFVLLGIGTPLLGVALTLLLVRRRATPVEPDRGRAEMGARDGAA
jgi:magnesium transporter